MRKVFLVAGLILREWTAWASGAFSLPAAFSEHLPWIPSSLGAPLFWWMTALAGITAAFRVGERYGASAELGDLSLHQAALYIRDRSAWARQRRDVLNFWQQVEDEIAAEITRAAKFGEITVFAREPNSIDLKEIPRGYWSVGAIDELRIWDDRNKTGTVIVNHTEPVRTGLWHYKDVMIPAAQVFSRWPEMSLPRRWLSDQVFLLRHVLQGHNLERLDKPRSPRRHRLEYSHPSFLKAVANEKARAEEKQWQ